MTEPRNRDRLDVQNFLLAGLYEVCARPWIQGATNRESDGGVCAMGALFVAQRLARASGCSASGPCLLEAHERLEAAAAALTGEPVTVPTFNDAAGRTKADIIRLYETAIADTETAMSPEQAANELAALGQELERATGKGI
jgi:hypothetical protein